MFVYINDNIKKCSFFTIYTIFIMTLFSLFSKVS